MSNQVNDLERINELVANGVFELAAEISAKQQPIEHESISMINEISLLFAKSGDYVVHMLNKLCSKNNIKFKFSSEIDQLLNSAINVEEEINILEYDFDPIMNLSRKPTKSYPPTITFEKLDLWNSLELKKESSNKGETMVKKALSSVISSEQVYGRFGKVERELCTFVSIKQMESCVEALANIDVNGLELNELDKRAKFGWELVGVGVINQILKQYDAIPWVEERGVFKLRKGFEKAMATLPSLIVSLMNVACQEFFNNLTSIEAEYACLNLLTWFKGSFFDNALNSKSKCRQWEREMRKSVSLCGTLSFTDSGTNGAGECQKIEEVDNSFDEEIEVEGIPAGTLKFIGERMQLLKNLPSTGDFIRAAKNTETLRKAIMVGRIISTPSVYYHSSKIFTSAKSGVPKVSGLGDWGIKPKTWIRLKGRLVPFRYEVQESCLFFRVANDYFNEKIKPTYIAARVTARTRDYEAEFMASLTNRSQGARVSDDLTISPTLRRMSNGRYVNELLQHSQKITQRGIESGVARPNALGSRAQIDRRQRDIVQVNNDKQKSSFPSLTVMNKVKPYIPEIAIGEGIGSGVDNLQQHSKTNGRYIANAMDLSGADTHTLKELQVQFLRYKLLECIEGEDIPNYFGFGNVETVEVDKQGNETKRRLNALEHCLLYLDPSDINASQLMYDRHFKLTTKLSGMSFESGLFGTSTQHTMMMTCGLRGLERWYRNTHGILPTIQLRVMGDDIEQIFLTTDDELVRAFVKWQREELLQANYVVEDMMSRNYDVFLQQDAINTVLLPSPHRMSLFTDERGDGVRRLNYDRIKDFSNVVKQYGARCFSEIHEDPLTFGVWQAIRSSFLLKSMGELKGKFKKMTKEYSDGYLLQLPIWMINTPLARMGWPSTSFKSPEGRKVLALGTMSTVIGGDGAYIEITNRFKLSDVIIGNETIDKLLDVPLLEELGILQSLFIGSINTVDDLSIERKRLIGEDKILEMISVATTYQDQDLRASSYLAKAELDERSWGIPDRLVYYNLPQIKVEQAINEQDLTVDEKVFINQSWYRRINDINYMKWLRSEETRRKFLFGFVAFTSKEEQTGFKSNVNPYLAISPTYHMGSHSLALIQATGYVFDEDRNDIVGLGRFINSYVKGGVTKLDDILEEGIKLFNKSNGDTNAIYLLGKANGLSEVEVSKLTQVVLRLSEEVPSTPFAAIRNNAQNFYRSFGVMRYRPSLAYKPTGKTSKARSKQRNLALVLLREKIFSIPDKAAEICERVQYVLNEHILRLLAQSL